MKQISLAEVDQYHHQMKGSTDQSLAPSIEMHLQLHVHQLIHDFLFSPDGDHNTSSPDSVLPLMSNGPDMMFVNSNCMANGTWIWGENGKLTTTNPNVEATGDQKSSVSTDIMTIITVNGENRTLATSKPKDEAKYDQGGLVSGDMFSIITVKDQKLTYCDDAKEFQDSDLNHVSSVIEVQEEYRLFQEMPQSNTFQCGDNVNILPETNAVPFERNTNAMSASIENSSPSESKLSASPDSDGESKANNSISKNDEQTFPSKKGKVRTVTSDIKTLEVKPSFRKPPRPPRLAKSPSDSAHPFLRCSSDISLLLKSTRKVRVDRRKVGSVTSSTASSIWALIFTLFFAVAMIAQGCWFQTRSARQSVLPSPPSDTSYMMKTSSLSPPIQVNSRATDSHIDHEIIKHEIGSPTIRQDDTSLGAILQSKEASRS